MASNGDRTGLHLGAGEVVRRLRETWSNSCQERVSIARRWSGNGSAGSEYTPRTLNYMLHKLFSLLSVQHEPDFGEPAMSVLSESRPRSSTCISNGVGFVAYFSTLSITRAAAIEHDSELEWPLARGRLRRESTGLAAWTM